MDLRLLLNAKPRSRTGYGTGALKPFLSRRYSSIVAVWLSGLFLSGAAAGTELRLRFTDEQGQAVRLSKAELLLVAWGDAQRLELETDGPLLVLQLDESWLRPQWPRFQGMDKVYLFLQAEDYVPIRSEAFLWIGAHGPPHGPRVGSTVIAFPGGRNVTLKEGDALELTLAFRKPKKRFLRFIDDKGEPVPGVEIESYMFWSRSNHCGRLTGGDLLGETVSDQEGRAPIPDGDFEYIFLLKKRRYALEDPQGFRYTPTLLGLVTYLNAETTTVEMRRWRKRPLEMRVTQNGAAAAGQVLFSWIAGCPCGACWGPLATTDKLGIIHIPEFYPEEWRFVYFEDDAGKTSWQTSPAEWPSTGIIEVEIGAEQIQKAE